MNYYETFKQMLALVGAGVLFIGLMVLYSIAVHLEDSWRERNGKYAKKS